MKRLIIYTLALAVLFIAGCGTGSGPEDGALGADRCLDQDDDGYTLQADCPGSKGQDCLDWDPDVNPAKTPGCEVHVDECPNYPGDPDYYDCARCHPLDNGEDVEDDDDEDDD